MSKTLCYPKYGDHRPHHFDIALTSEKIFLKFSPIGISIPDSKRELLSLLLPLDKATLLSSILISTYGPHQRPLKIFS